MRGVDPSGLWEEQGHFYTVYIVGRAAGMTHREASVMAYYAQLPDEDAAFNATTAGVERVTDWTGTDMFKKDAHRKDIQEVLHSLHGGDAIKRRDCLKKLLKEEKLKPWQKGLIIHAFGDAYAHSYVEDGKVKAYGGITGHGIFPTAAGWVTNPLGLGNVFGGHPDSIGLHNNTYRKYVNDLYDVLKTGGGDPSRIGALEGLADTFSRNRTSVEGEIAALRKLAIERGYTSSYAPEASGEERLPKFEHFHGDITDKEIKEVIALIKKACKDERKSCDTAPSKGFDAGPSNCPTCNA